MDFSAHHWALLARSKDPLLLTFNFFSTVFLVFVNKWVFMKVHFPFSVTLSCVHYLVTYVFLCIMKHFGIYEVPANLPPPKNFWYLVLVIGLATPLNNVSLKLNSIGVYQMLKLLVVPAIALLEFALSGKAISVRRAVLLTILTVAAGLSSVSDVVFSAYGLLAAMVWVPIAAAYKVLWSEAEKRDGWQTLALMYKIYPYATAVTMCMVPLLDPPGLSEFRFTLSSTSLILLSGLGAFFVNWSGFMVMGSCSAMTHQLLGQAKSIITMLAGFMLLAQGYTLVTLISCLVGMMTIVAYTDANLKENAARSPDSQMKT